MARPAWDRNGCMEKVCVCHDDSATPYSCSGCGCRANTKIPGWYPPLCVCCSQENCDCKFGDFSELTTGPDGHPQTVTYSGCMTHEKETD